MNVTIEGDYFNGFFQIWSLGLQVNEKIFSIFLSLDQRNKPQGYITMNLNLFFNFLIYFNPQD